MSFSKKYPRIEQFLGTRLHNFWPEEYGTWENAINDSCEEASVSVLYLVHQELNTLNSSGFSEKELDDILYKECGANFYPPGSGLTYQQWIEKVNEMVGDWIKKKEKEEGKSRPGPKGTKWN